MQDDNRAEPYVGPESIVGGTDQPQQLAVAVPPSGPPGTVVLRVTGELGYETAALLRDALKENAVARRVVVDCSGLRFCDSTGLKVLLKARLRMLGGGGRLDLAGLRSPVARMLEITGARMVFRVYGDVAEALADVDSD
ncbi:STAS domain-containing protein [Streptomyces sp. SJL17-1]|uniref:STAS domain-containing protein n=1 Tax=Streptomyces sp. SJL17-1 TaxID=2967223 RepID=UPI0029669493|nr:STAS domain-containing protein [Streptomyces sp. SJL17-1]